MPMAAKIIFTLWLFIPSLHFSLFPEPLQLFVLSSFYFSCTSLSRDSYCLLPLELIYFIDCCMVASWEFLRFFLFFLQVLSDVSLILCIMFLFYFFTLMVHTSRYFLREVLKRLIFLVPECHQGTFFCPHVWFDRKSALEIIWSQNTSAFALSSPECS